MQVYDQGLPGEAKETFFEGYTDSPEFSRFENPVVHHRQDPDDDDDDDQDYVGPSKLANYLSPMDRPKADVLDFRRMAIFGAHRQAQTSIFFGRPTGHDEVIPSVEPADAAENATTQAAENATTQASHADIPDGLVDDDDDEEPEDDTFEFLMR